MASKILWKNVERKLWFKVPFPKKLFSHFKANWKQPNKSTWYSTNVASSKIPQGKQGFLVYQDLHYNLLLPRAFVGFACLACGTSLIVSNDLKKKAIKEEEEVSESKVERTPHFMDNLYAGAFGRAMPYVYTFTGIAIIGLTSLIVGANVKKILLSTNHQTVTIVSYKLFGGNKIIHVPKEDITYNQGRMKIKNYVKACQTTSKTGKIINKTLFDHITNQ